MMENLDIDEEAAQEIYKAATFLLENGQKSVYRDSRVQILVRYDTLKIHVIKLDEEIPVFEAISGYRGGIIDFVSKYTEIKRFNRGLWEIHIQNLYNAKMEEKKKAEEIAKLKEEADRIARFKPVSQDLDAIFGNI